ncbi:Zn-ribbon domain-containing OB-fold protein [Acidianus sp. HS-5]|uniref:Zn-ribbon domain-containing OB-fold protein n=1 Tax=Acidianus sp. HS-5 TaxID=2886040 RepID=UPI001F2A00E8|nr:Zn-ribbon domain-containing OB-fold protein [Acidianus sp. HS-5]BDC19815.1 DNA-binding protein [Acidianus sp. HS-5]
MKVFPAQIWRNKESLYSLIAGKCNKCENLFFPYREVCNKCGSTSISKVKLSGRGTLISYTMSYQNRPGFEKTTPEYIGLIRLDEGIEIVAPLTDVTGEIKDNSRVEAVIRRLKADSSNGLIEYGIKFRLVEDENR